MPVRWNGCIGYRWSKSDEWLNWEEDGGLGAEEGREMVESEGGNGFGLTMEFENQAAVVLV